MELEDGRFPPVADSPGAHTPLTVAWMLHPDEQVLWVGRPSTWWRTVQPTDKWSISNGLAWLAVPPLIWLAIFGGKIPTLFLIFWLAGLVYCFWSVVSRRLSWRKVTYVLTDQRAFIVEESALRPLRQVELASVHLDVAGVRPDGTGTLFFLANCPSLNVQMFPVAARTDYRYRFDFVSIADVYQVHDLAEVGTRELR